MKPILFLVLLVALILFGCGKRQPQEDGAGAVDSSAQSPSTPSSVAADPPREVRAKTVSRPTPQVLSRTENVIRQSVSGMVEPSMTAQLQAFVAQKGRLPDNFAEFANTKLDTVPRPPEGMRWVID